MTAVETLLWYVLHLLVGANAMLGAVCLWYRAYEAAGFAGAGLVGSGACLFALGRIR